MWQEAEEFLKKDKYIFPLIQKWGSCTIKPIKKSLYFVDLVEAITNQQLSGKAASTIFGRVKALCKGDFSPESILNLSEAELRGAGLSFAKIKYVKDLASKVKSDELQIHKLDKLSDEEVIKELVVVKGIGQWTAEMFLMFALARPDVFPKDDLGINKAMKKLKPKNSDRWKPYRTVASWYLWRSLENR